MNKRKAKGLIKELQAEISGNNIQNQFWMDKVQAYVQAIFGGSEESIAMPMFHTYYFDRPYSNWVKKDNLEEVVNKLKAMLDVYIVLIDNDLIVHRNIFSKFENWTIFGIVAGFVFVSFTIIGTVSYYQGSNNSELKKAELFNENVQLRDSIKIFKININEKNKPSTTLPASR